MVKLSATAASALASLLLAGSASAFSPSPSAFRVRSRGGHGDSASPLRMSSSSEYDFDVAIVGCGVGGHGAALHSRGQGLKTAVFSGGDVGGTCVNRGCVPSKALLAASGRVRDMRDSAHLESMGITVEGEVTYDREGIAAHAKNLANRVKGNLENSLVSLGCDVIEGRGALTGTPHEIKDEGTGKVYTAKVSFFWVVFSVVASTPPSLPCRRRRRCRCRPLFLIIIIIIIIIILFEIAQGGERRKNEKGENRGQ